MATPVSHFGIKCPNKNPYLLLKITRIFVGVQLDGIDPKKGEIK
jgi:hypothetical protein